MMRLNCQVTSVFLGMTFWGILAIHWKETVSLLKYEEEEKGKETAPKRKGPYDNAGLGILVQPFVETHREIIQCLIQCLC